MLTEVGVKPAQNVQRQEKKGALTRSELDYVKRIFSTIVVCDGGLRLSITHDTE